LSQGAVQLICTEIGSSGAQSTGCVIAICWARTGPPAIIAPVDKITTMERKICMVLPYLATT